MEMVVSKCFGHLLLIAALRCLICLSLTDTETVCRFKELDAFWEHDVELVDIICADPRIFTMKSEKLISKCVHCTQVLM